MLLTASLTQDGRKLRNTSIPNPYVAICNTEQRLMMSAASEFGLTPSARSRIMAASTANKNDVDEMEALLGGDA